MKTLRLFAILAGALAGIALLSSCEKDEVTGTMVLGKDTYTITHSMYFEEQNSIHIDFDADDGAYHGFCHEISNSCIGKSIDVSKHFAGGTYDIGINAMSGNALLSLYNEADGISNGPNPGSPFKSGTFLVKKDGNAYVFKLDAVFENGTKLKISFKALEGK